MRQHLLKLLQASSGVSAMRAMSLLCVLTACGIAIAGASRAVPDYLGLSELCGTLLTAGFAGKAYQKKIEASDSGRNTRP